MGWAARMNPRSPSYRPIVGRPEPRAKKAVRTQVRLASVAARAGVKPAAYRRVSDSKFYRWEVIRVWRKKQRVPTGVRLRRVRQAA